MDTIPKLLLYQAQERSDHPALRIKRLGIWETRTWSMVSGNVKRLAGGLLDYGVTKGEPIVVIGNNTPDIYCAISACQVVGAIAAPVFSVPPRDSFASVMQATQARIVIVQDQQQVDALLALKNLEQPLEAIIYIEKRGIDSTYDAQLVSSYQDLCERGDRYLDSQPAQTFEQLIGEGREDDPAIIIFNSGTDAAALPVALTHKNILSTGRYLAEQENITDADEMLSFMPISLGFNLLCSYVLSHVAGFCISCPENTETVMENLHEVTPSILYAPPYAYKQIATSMRERIDVARGMAARLYARYVRNPAEQGGNKLSWLDNALGDILVRAPIRNLYGLGRLRLGFTGGDSVHVGTFNLFSALGVELKQIYGAAETSGCITVQVEERTADNVGHVMQGAQLKISEQGEVLCKGPNVFSGYYKNQEATQKVIDSEGWYHSGDIGEIREDGTVHIYDKLSARTQFKDGNMLLPKVVENAIKGSLFVKEAFVTDLDGSDLYAVVCIDPDSVGRWAEHHGVRYTSYADLASTREVEQLIYEAIQDANQEISGTQPAVKKYSLMRRPFSPTTGELTWTNKLRRTFLKDCFSKANRTVDNGQECLEIAQAADDQVTNLKVLQCG